MQRLLAFPAFGNSGFLSFLFQKSTYWWRYDCQLIFFYEFRFLFVITTNARSQERICRLLVFYTPNDCTLRDLSFDVTRHRVPFKISRVRGVKVAGVEEIKHPLHSIVSPSYKNGQHWSSFDILSSSKDIRGWRFLRKHPVYLI